MKSIAMQLFAALAAAALSTAVLADGKGGGAAGVRAGAGANVNAGAGAGAGGAHMSTSGQANTNSRFAEERQLGLDRAAARRSAQGAAHEKGSISSAKSQGPKPVTGASVEAEGAAKSKAKPE